MRHERRPLADRSQSVHGQRHLILAATPGARRLREAKHRRFRVHHEVGIRDSQTEL
jgi:hypothetical protein